jgi:hypothetical protein
MAWLFAVPLSLIFFFPGICGWVGLRAGAAQDYLSPIPDKFRSTEAFFIILLGTLCGHALGTLFFTLMEFYCAYGPCHGVIYEPNIYKRSISEDVHPISAGAISLSVVFVLLLGLGIGSLFYKLAPKAFVTAALRPAGIGWIRSIGQAASDDSKLVTAFILTKVVKEDRIVAYEGMVRQLTLDDEQKVAMIVLEEVDRFIVQVTQTKLKRINSEVRPIPSMQFVANEISNVAFEIIEVPKAPEAAET